VGDPRVAPRLRVFPDLEAASDALADRIAHAAREAVAARGGFSIVLSGGSTPLPLYRRLATRYRREIDWSRADVYFGDERCVGPRSPESNYASARAALLSRLPVPTRRVHRIRGELRPPSAAAWEYARTIGPVRTQGKAPRFDVVLLGLGPDGHTASLFPGAPALRVRSRSVVSVRRSPTPPHVPRVTLTVPALVSARHVWFLVSGEEKAGAVARTVGRRRDPGHPTPAGRLVESTPTEWFLDRAAARELRAP